MAFNAKYWKEYNFFLKQLSVREPLRVGLFTLNLSEKFTIPQETAYKLITDLYTYNEKLFSIKDNIVSATGYTKRFIKYGGFFWVYFLESAKKISFALAIGVSIIGLFYPKPNGVDYSNKIKNIDTTLEKLKIKIEELQERIIKDSISYPE